MNTKPFVSVLMPVRNEGEYIERTLQSVLNQDYPRESFEVIVANGQSEDETEAIVQSYKQKYFNLAIIENPEKIVAIGLNRAMNHARGEIIIRVDGHCQINPDYIDICVKYLKNGYDAVGGSWESVGETNVAKVIAAAVSSVFGVGNSAHKTTFEKSVLADTIPFPAYNRSLLEKAGNYDEELVRNQDDELNFRLRKQGVKLLLAADLRCRYFVRRTFRSLWRQYFQYGFWKVRVLQKHPRQMQWRHFVPPVFLSSLILLLALSPFSSVARTALLSIAAVYLTVVFFGILHCRQKATGQVVTIVTCGLLHFAFFVWSWFPPRPASFS